MEIDLTTPALLFSAISLIMLAYTNRFLSYAQLVRTLKEQYMENPSSVKAAQIANLRKRHLLSAYIFGLALILLIISLAISVYEIYISVKSLEIHLNDMHE